MLEDVMTFFWSLPDFGRKIGRHAVRFQGSVETATKLLGFGRLARVKKHCTKPIGRLKVADKLRESVALNLK